MYDGSLIEKLLTAGVIEKRINELKFSDDFCKHLVSWNAKYGFNGGGTIETWRQIILEFNKGLGSLSDREIAMTIVLLDYFLDKISAEKA